MTAEWLNDPLPSGALSLLDALNKAQDERDARAVAWLSDELLPRIDSASIKPYVPTRRERVRWWINAKRDRLTELSPIVICKRSTWDERRY